MKLIQMGKKRKSSRSLEASTAVPQQRMEDCYADCYEGERLDELIDKIDRKIELASLLKRGLPDKIWIKQQFAVGINDVTRLLDRMPRGEREGNHTDGTTNSSHRFLRPTPFVPLQAVLVAGDCSPKWLTKHIPALASSRKVPIILIKDRSGASLRLGGLLKLKTALAIGIKARGSSINEAFDEIL